MLQFTCNQCSIHFISIDLTLVQATTDGSTDRSWHSRCRMKLNWIKANIEKFVCSLFDIQSYESIPLCVNSFNATVKAPHYCIVKLCQLWLRSIPKLYQYTFCVQFCYSADCTACFYYSAEKCYTYSTSTVVLHTRRLAKVCAVTTRNKKFIVLFHRSVNLVYKNTRCKIQ